MGSFAMSASTFTRFGCLAPSRQINAVVKEGHNTRRPQSALNQQPLDIFILALAN